MSAAVQGWSGEMLKTMNAHLSASVGGKLFQGLRAGKKDDMIDDLLVALDAARAKQGTRRYGASGSLTGAQVAASLAEQGLAAYEAAFRKTVATLRVKKARAALPTAAKDLDAKLSVLDKAQLVHLVQDLIANGSLDAAAVAAALPAPDLAPKLAECARLVRLISKSLPYTKYGSKYDHFGYKRCATAVNAAKKALIDSGNELARCKQWAVALKYGNDALVIAEEMPTWNQDSDNGARTAVFKFLHGLVDEASKHVAVA